MTPAPHTYSLYEDYCRLLSSGAFNILPLPLPDFLADDRINVFIRHDIDHLGCILALPGMLDLERRYGLVSSSYIIVDGSRYHPALAKPVVERYSDMGFGFGLHSNCYLYGEALPRFINELELYAELFGAPPKHFTQHGQGTLEEESRQRFNDSVRKEGGASGIPTDIGFPYVLRFTDSKTEAGTKVLSHSPTELAEDLQALERGDTALFLTHPFRWTPHTHKIVTINMFNNHLFCG